MDWLEMSRGHVLKIHALVPRSFDGPRPVQLLVYMHTELPHRGRVVPQTGITVLVKIANNATNQRLQGSVRYSK
jgi:hypothetical protein